MHDLMNDRFGNARRSGRTTAMLSETVVTNPSRRPKFEWRF